MCRRHRQHFANLSQQHLIYTVDLSRQPLGPLLMADMFSVMGMNFTKVVADLSCDAATLRSLNCSDDDLALARYTVIRYVVLASYMALVINRIKSKAKELDDLGKELKDREKQELKDRGKGTDSPLRKGRPQHPVERILGNGLWANRYPFKENPNLTKSMLNPPCGGCCGLWAFVCAFGIFVQTEGVGLVVYFAVSAILDNATIFFLGDIFCSCKYATSVSLYTCALLSFLPTAGLSKAVQKTWWDGKPWAPLHCRSGVRWYQNRIFFLVAMTVVTVIFFVLRACFVKALHVNRFFKYHLDKLGRLEYDYDGDKQQELGDFKVFVAACIPPIVDLIQSIILVAASSLTGAEALEDVENDLVTARDTEYSNTPEKRREPPPLGTQTRPLAQPLRPPPLSTRTTPLAQPLLAASAN